MKKTVLYIHGKDGEAEEAEHYVPLFPDCTVIGIDYFSETPWQAKREFPRILRQLRGEGPVWLVANSIGAYFAMHAFAPQDVERAWFISPVVDMAELIGGMMAWADVTDDILEKEKVIETGFGEVLSWDYLQYARENPCRWDVPTEILYGAGDELTSCDTMETFAKRIGAGLTVMEDGEHWFHTEEQMAFLDRWIENTK